MGRPGGKLVLATSILLLTLGSGLGAAAQSDVSRSLRGPGGEPLALTTDDEILLFLAEADVISIEDIPEGITNPRKVLLEKDGIRAHAVFRVVDEVYEEVRLSDGRLRQRLRDSASLEVAAYKFSLILGIPMVPPTVERRIGREEGTLQVWIENAMTESERKRTDAGPANLLRLSRAIQSMRAFDILVGNDDRNPGNILYELETWQLWMIDHTRAFQAFYGNPDFTEVNWCERRLWEKLQVLDAELVEAELGDYLSDHEIAAMLERRDELVAHIQRLIDERGRDAVLY